jgi:hypothetical protein
LTQSRFKGFDDFGASQLAIATSIPEAIEDEGIPCVQPIQESLSHSIPSQRPITNSRKRAIPLSDDDGEDDGMDSLLPAAAAMKKRRLDAGTFTTRVDEKTQSKADAILARKPRKEIDVLEVARQRREAEDERARKNAEALKEAMEGMDVNSIRKSITMKVMELKIQAKPDESDKDQNERWNEKWNGRKNFKKFRRKGEPQHIRGHAVIVPLEQVKKKSFGIGQDHWLESASKQVKTSQAPGPSQTLCVDADEEEESQSRRMPGRNRITRRPAPDVVDAVDVVDESIVPESTSSTTRVSQTQTQKTQTRTQPTQKDKKRLGGELPKGNMQPPKRRKGAPAKRKDDDSDDGSEDDTKFRFSRRKR